MVSERTFGVEIECTYGKKPTKTNYAPNDDRYTQRERATKDLSKNSDLKEWAKNIGIDGSGIEIRSPVLKGKEGFEELSAVFDFLTEKGSTVTNQDGMHVHHGAADFAKNGEAVLRLVKSWAEFTPTINTLVAPRRRNSTMCYPTWDKARITELEAALGSDYERLSKEYNDALERYYKREGPLPEFKAIRRPYAVTGRGALNINNVWSDNNYANGKQTIEIRLSEGLMDRDSAISWVKFGQSFIESMVDRKRPLSCSQSLESLFRAIKLDAEAAKVLKAKADNKGKALVNAAPGKIANGVAYDESED